MTAHVWTFFEEGEHPTDKQRHYRCDDQLTTPSGLEIVSVTTALDVLYSPAIPVWVANVTAEGAWTLGQRDGYELPSDIVRRNGSTWPGWRQLLGDIRDAGLDHESIRDEAALRGTCAHEIHENYVRHGAVPSFASHPPGWHGFLQAMARYIVDSERAGETPESVESLVASAEYGFAGQCDVVVKTKDGRRIRRDFKSSKQVYARKHFRQLAAYEFADVEMGNEPTDEQQVVILRPDGTWYAVTSTATAQDFLNVLQVYRDDQPFLELEEKAYKARKAYERKTRQKEKVA